MNLSIESILEETLDYDEGGQQSVAATITKVVPSVAKQPPTTVSLTSGTKIKMIPSSQFVHLKTLPTQSKLINYTISKSNNSTSAAGSPASIGSIVKTIPNSSGQQIFTLKTPTGQTTQFVTAASSSSTTAQQKYTVIKNANGMTMLQLTKNVPAPPAISSNVDLSNIIDMPIVFADNEGNIADQQQQQKQQQSEHPLNSKNYQDYSIKFTKLRCILLQHLRRAAR